MRKENDAIYFTAATTCCLNL